MSGGPTYGHDHCVPLRLPFGLIFGTFFATQVLAAFFAVVSAFPIPVRQPVRLLRRFERLAS